MVSQIKSLALLWVHAWALSGLMLLAGQRIPPNGSQISSVILVHLFLFKFSFWTSKEVLRESPSGLGRLCNFPAKLLCGSLRTLSGLVPAGQTTSKFWGVNISSQSHHLQKMWVLGAGSDRLDETPCVQEGAPTWRPWSAPSKARAVVKKAGGDAREAHFPGWSGLDRQGISPHHIKPTRIHERGDAVLLPNRNPQQPSTTVKHL